MAGPTTGPDLKSTRTIADQTPENSGYGGGLRFDTWHSANDARARDAQIADGYMWLCDAMVNVPDQMIFQHHITDGYVKGNWRDHRGKKGAKECFNAYWDSTQKSHIPLLKIVVNDFSREKQPWNGNPTITRLWEDAKAAHYGGQRDERQSSKQRVRAEMEAAQREEEAAVRRAIAEASRLEDEHDAARIAKNLAASIARYKELPDTEPGLYFSEKGFGNIKIPSLKRGRHPRRGGYDVLPIQDVETGKTVSLAYFWDEPFLNQSGKLVRKSFAAGGRTKGCGIFLNGYPPKSYAGKIRTGEGVATALRVKACDRSTGDVCYAAALFAKNLSAVAGALDRRCPKATLELVLDNDWQKALEVDEKGRPKPNTGLKIGHEVAMKGGYMVLQPDFSSLEGQERTGTLSDFDDLWRATDDEEVQRQLIPRHPDPEWAFKGVKETEQRRLRALFCNHELTIINQPFLEPTWIQRGRDNAARSIHGSGKTRSLEDFLEANPDLSVLYICPLAALAVESAAKFAEYGFTCYQDVRDDVQLRRVRRLTTTPDSLIRLTSKGAPLPHYDVVVNDEPEYTFRRLLSPMPYKKVVFDTLRCVLQRAETTVWLDADLKQPTVNHWARWLPESRFNVVLNEHVTDGVFTVMPDQASVQNLALEMLGNGERITYSTNHKKPARAAQLLIQERLPDCRTLYISADNGGDDDVQMFFQNVAGTVADLDCLLYTPKVSTGVSIDEGHPFTAGLCEVYTSADVGTPNGAVQQIERARGVKHKFGWVENTRARPYPTDPAEIAARWGESHKWDANLLGLTPDGRRGLSDPDYEGIALDVTIADNYAKGNFRWEFLRQLYLRGYTIRFADRTPQPGPDEEDPISERRALEQAAHEAEVTANDRNDAQRAANIDRQQNATSAETGELTAYRIRHVFALEDAEDVDADHVRQYRRGALARELSRLETATANQATLRVLSERQHHEGELYARDMRLYGVEGTVGRWVLEALNINAETLEVRDSTPVRPDSPAITQLIETLIEHRLKLRGARIMLPLPETMRQSPMTTVGALLRRLNLKTRAVGRNQPRRPRVIDPDALEYMRELVVRRRERAARLSGVGDETVEVYRRENTPTVSPRLSGVADETVEGIKEENTSTVSPRLSHPNLEEVLPDPETPDDLEALRAALTTGHLRDSRPAPVLLECYRLADEGDETARGDLLRYLANPAVRQTLHQTAPTAHGGA